MGACASWECVQCCTEVKGAGEQLGQVTRCWPWGLWLHERWSPCCAASVGFSLVQRLQVQGSQLCHAAPGSVLGPLGSWCCRPGSGGICCCKPASPRPARGWESQAKLEGHFPPGTCVTPSHKPRLLLKLESTCHRGRPRGMARKGPGSFPCCAEGAWLLEGSRPFPLPQGPHTRHHSLKATMLSIAVLGGSRESPCSHRALEPSCPRSCLACGSLEQ